MDLWILDVPYLLNLLAIYLSPGAHGSRYTNRRDAPLPGPSRLRRRRRWRRGGRQADGNGWHQLIGGFIFYRSNPNVIGHWKLLLLWKLVVSNIFFSISYIWVVIRKPLTNSIILQRGRYLWQCTRGETIRIGCFFFYYY